MHLVSFEPVVSVVIPTRDRANLVVRAAKSALGQTLRQIEVIVIIDGPDFATARALADIKDSRLRVIPLAKAVGGSEVRNIGARASRGEFVAFLDDDDEWAPGKLTQQVEAARASEASFPVVTCRLIARRPDNDEVWPLRQIRPSEPMSEYLLCRENSVRQGEGFIQTSTLLIPRELIIEIPFTRGLPRHQDWDWLVRVSVHPGVEFVWVWKPLVIYHINAGRQSISSGRSLDASLSWVTNNLLITPKARAYFYATQIAVRCKTPRVLWTVVRNTITNPRAFFIAMGLIFTPRQLVHSFRQRSRIAHA